MRKIYYYCYDMPEKKAWLQQSMEELPKYLAMPPANIDYEFTELPEEFEDDILEIFKKNPNNIHDWENDIIEYFADKQGQVSSLLVICPEGSHLEKVSKKALPDAVWGIATYSLSIVYVIHDKYIIWHEVLHLLGSNDCYDLEKEDRGPSCELDNCIMQFEATRGNVGDWQFLCKGNIERIQKQIKKWES